MAKLSDMSDSDLVSYFMDAFRCHRDYPTQPPPEPVRQDVRDAVAEMRRRKIWPTAWDERHRKSLENRK